MRKRQWLIMGLTWLSVSVLGAQVPERSISGQTLAVPEADMDAGSVFYVMPGQDTQLIITSDGFLRRVAVTSNRIVGYVVIPFDLEESAQAPVAAGAFRLPVASLRTSVDGGDDILQGGKFLDRVNHPEIFYQITSVSDAVVTERTDTETRFDVRLHGNLTVKGNSREVSIEASMRHIPENFRIYSRSYGDILILRGRFNLKPASFDWRPERAMTDQVAEELGVDLYLVMSIISPDKSPFPEGHPVYYPKQFRFLTYLRDLDDPETAYRFGAEFMQEIWDNASELQKLADGVIKTEGVRERDYAFARRAMQRACELNGEKDPGQLQSLAAIYYEMGDGGGAVAWQRKAIALLQGGAADALSAARETLARYEKTAAQE